LVAATATCLRRCAKLLLSFSKIIEQTITSMVYVQDLCNTDKIVHFDVPVL